MPLMLALLFGVAYLKGPSYLVIVEVPDTSLVRDNQ